jgi:threonine/homoserine/homoserine lactone efflux protein
MTSSRYIRVVRLMIDPAVLPGFLAAVLVICLAPGPDMAFIVAASFGWGARAGVKSAVGMAMGMALWTIGSVIGLSALLRTESAAFDAVRLAGAAYLCWLGFDTFRSLRVAPHEDAPAEAGERLVLRGLIANLTNPKILVFFVAFLPGFVSSHSSSAGAQLLTLGVLFLLVGLCVDSGVALAAGRLREFARPGGRAALVMTLAAGVTYLVLAVVIVAEMLS